jgi:RNA polymerase sigma-70 factor (ECF subfamily)
MERASELALVQRLRAGDATAFDDVYAAFNTRLFTFLLRLSRRYDLAEDLLEETWLRLVRRAGDLRPDTTLGPWLFTVGRNLYYSVCRNRGIGGLCDGDTPLAFVAATTPSPFELTAASERERHIEAALASLPAALREVLLLVGVEGLTPTEAAAICGINVDALRQRLHRARTMLARRLDAADHVAVLREART